MQEEILSGVMKTLKMTTLEMKWIPIEHRKKPTPIKQSAFLGLADKVSIVKVS